MIWWKKNQNQFSNEVSASFESMEKNCEVKTLLEKELHSLYKTMGAIINQNGLMNDQHGTGDY